MTPTPDKSRELDAEVAMKVFSWEQTRDFKGHLTGYAIDANGDFRNLPHYSTDPTAAFEVVNKMLAEGWEFHMFGPFKGVVPQPQQWSATFQRHGDGSFDGDASSPAEAISRAALAAMEARK